MKELNVRIEYKNQIQELNARIGIEWKNRKQKRTCQREHVSQRQVLTEFRRLSEPKFAKLITRFDGD